LEIDNIPRKLNRPESHIKQIMSYVISILVLVGCASENSRSSAVPQGTREPRTTPIGVSTSMPISIDMHACIYCSASEPRQS